MSPILDIQRRMREIGRIRTGVQVASSDGKKRRPATLETFRLTSVSRELIAAAAEAYGGEARPWQNGDTPEWEVVTHAISLDVVIPRGEPVTQWNELWRAGGCVRRCDGRTNVLTDGPCECPADPVQRQALAEKGEACKPTTRLSVLLPALPDLGTWRLESHGYYAAVELGGSADVLLAASEAGYMLPARLRLDQRKRKRPGEPAKQFAVPVLELVQTRMADIPMLAPGESGAADRLPPGRPAVPALPATTLPATSDFRAPVPEVEQEHDGSNPEAAGAIVSPEPAATPPAPPSGACGAPSALHEEERCGLKAGHKPPHRSLGQGGIVTGSW